LVEAYAGGCRVELVGLPPARPRSLKQSCRRPASDEEIEAEIAPCFVEDGAARTDVVVLACTHYPLLLPRLRRLAPWPVVWLDPAPAVARRVDQILGPALDAPACTAPALATFTAAGELQPTLSRALAARGLAEIVHDSHPLGPSPTH
jgi:glutamate racemase